MSKYLFCAIALFLAIQSAAAQKIMTAPADDEMYFWKILSKVKSKTTFDPKTNNVFYQPVFSKGIEALDGKLIAIQGYMIPADMARGKLTLSAYPFSSCFFCGQAGPESVIEIEAKVPIIYRMDRPVTVQGRLKLNRNDDPFRLLYILQDAEQYSGD